MLALLLCAFASLHCSSSLDQTSISVIDKKTNRKLLISKVDADVQIYGTIAETRLAITFSNHTDRTLEASVELPLAEGASISGYQLEVNGKLREGVIVDKDLGRQAFENVIRQRIDPGLLEKGDGNSFKTRIYPVPAKGSKTFVLNYIEPLKYDSKGRGKYSLPVTSRSRIEDFKIKVNGTGVSIYYENKLFGNSFVQNKTVRKKSFRPGSLDLILQQDLATRTGIIAKGRDGKEYFYIDGGKEAKRSAIPRPKLIQLVWDASHSAKHRDKAKDIALLKSYLHHFKAFDLDLKVVRNRVASYGKFEVKDGKCDKLISLLHSIQADGSSEFDDVSYRSSHYDLSLLFSDGIGDVNTAVVKHPVYVVNSSNLENSAYLNYLVNTSGGRKVSSQSNDALEKLVTTGIQLKSVSGDVSNVKILRSGGNSYAVGRIVGDNKIKLHYKMVKPLLLKMLV